MVHALRTIDAHVAGQSLRLVVAGLPTPQGSTMLARHTWMARQADHLRKALMLEPRGHADMAGALLTEPVSPGAHAGVLFMHGAGYAPFCGHGLMAVATIALERGLIHTGAAPAGAVEAVETLRFDTLAGLVVVRAAVRAAVGAAVRGRTDGDGDGLGEGVRVRAITLTGVPAFVTRAGEPVRVVLRDGPRDARVDVAFGGGFYAIVDSEALGVALMPSAVPELRRAAAAIADALQGAPALVHPQFKALSGLEGVVFTGPPASADAHLRSVTVFADGAVDRSPCGGATAALMAVLHAMELLPPGEPFVHESLLGTRLVGRVVDSVVDGVVAKHVEAGGKTSGKTSVTDGGARLQVGDYPAIRTEVDGEAWITGEHTFLVDDADPLRHGFRL